MYPRGKVYYSCIAGPDGRMIRERLSGDLKVAKIMLTKMRRDVDLQKAGIIETPRVKARRTKSLEDVRQAYLAHLKSGKVSDATIESFQGAWAQVIFKNRLVYLGDITLAGIERWAQDCLEAGTLKGQSVNIYVGHILRALIWAMDNELIASNPLKMWKTVRPNEPAKKRDLSPAEINAILCTEGDFEWRTRWFVYLFTGLRKSAGASLMWEWVDWEKRMVKLPTEHNKSRKPLELPMHDAFYDTLKAWHEKCGSPIDGPVFKAISRNRVNVRLRKVCEKAGVNPVGVTPHSFRHTFATMIYEGTGKNLKAVQELLGHSSASTSMIYLHLSPEEKKLAISKLN